MFGFYAINGISVSFFPERSRKEDMCRFLDKVREANGERKMVMILDNCPVHRSAVVKEHAAVLDIILLFLPPYSPQFNPIELIWKTVKRAISRAFLLYKDHLMALVEEVFAKEAAKASYLTAWKADFLSNIILKS